jgi:hypothetical protein
MKRTPRSARRRASRQLEANDPSPGVQPYMSRVCSDSPLIGHEFRHGRLHAEGEFVLLDAGGDFRVAEF